MPLTIVLLPGMDGTGDLFLPFVTALGTDFDVRVVAYPRDGALGYRELERVALRSLPPRGDFVVLGESFSGPIAVSIAAARPAGLVGLILCSTFIRCPRPLIWVVRRVALAVPFKWFPDAVLSYFLLGRYATRSLRGALRLVLAKVSATALRSRIEGVLSVDVTSKLRSVQVPVLYLQATDDRVVPPSAARDAIAACPTMEVASLAAPHSLLQVAPAAAAAEVRRFFGRDTLESWRSGNGFLAEAEERR